MDYGAQAGDAGHPHWQFDALDSIRKEETVEAARMHLAVLKQEERGSEVQTFSPNSVQSSEIDEVIWAKDFSRVHFASAASWWKNAPENRHAHFPKEVSDIETWVQRTIEYSVGELGRLE